MSRPKKNYFHVLRCLDVFWWQNMLMVVHVLPVVVPVLAGEAIWPCLCWPVKLFGRNIRDRPAFVYFGFNLIICFEVRPFRECQCGRGKSAGQVSGTLQLGLQWRCAGHNLGTSRGDALIGKNLGEEWMEMH